MKGKIAKTAWVEFEVTGEIIGEDINSLVIKCGPEDFVAVEYGDADLPDISELIGKEVEITGCAKLCNVSWFRTAYEINVIMREYENGTRDIKTYPCSAPQP